MDDFRDPTMVPEMQERLGSDWQLLPGLNGVPYRTRSGTIPLLKESDPAHRRPQMQPEVSVRVFDLGEATERAEYERVLNLCARNLGRVMQQDTQYSEEDKTWRVLLTWATYFYEHPDETKQEQRKLYD